MFRFILDNVCLFRRLHRWCWHCLPECAALLQVCLLTTAGSALAQSDFPRAPAPQAVPREIQMPPAVSGAASYYKEALDLLNEKFSITDAWILGCFPREAGAIPTEQEKRLFNRFAPVLAKIRQGSAMAQFDPTGSSSSSEVTLAQSINMLHRTISYLRADTAYRYITGDSLGTTGDVAIMLNMSRQLTQCHRSMACLGAISLLSTSDESIHDYLIKAGMLTPANAVTLLGVLNTFDQSDPFNVKSVTEHDRLSVEDYFRDALNQPGWAATQAYMREDNGPAYDDQSPDDLRQGLSRFDEVMRSISEAFLLVDHDQARTKLGTISDEVSGGKFGLIARNNAGHYAHLYDRVMEAEKQLRELRDLLNRVVAGQVDLSDQANAAWFYIRAGQLVDSSLTPAQRMAVDDFAFDANLSHLDLAALNHDLEPIVDLIRQGSRLKTCDFQFGGQQIRNTLAPGYLSGMGRCFRVMLLAARLKLDAGDPDQAMQLVSADLRMVNHLSHDQILLCSDVSERAFDHALIMFRTIASTPDLAARLKPETLTALEAGIDALVRETGQDPFGYSAAMTELRTELSSWRFIALDSDGHTKVEEGTQNPIPLPDSGYPLSMIHSAPPDLLIHMVLILDVHNFRGDRPEGYNYMYDTLAAQLAQLKPPLDTLKAQWDLCIAQRAAIDIAIANSTLGTDWISNHTFRYGLNEDAARAQTDLQTGAREIKAFLNQLRR